MPMRSLYPTFFILLLSQASAEPLTEAYRVNIASHQNGLYTLTDGSVVARDVLDDVCYLSRNEEAILYKDEDGWRLCVDHANYAVEFVRQLNGYDAQPLSVSSLSEVESLDMCH
jgi:hypothetical protein